MSYLLKYVYIFLFIKEKSPVYTTQHRPSSPDRGDEIILDDVSGNANTTQI